MMGGESLSHLGHFGVDTVVDTVEHDEMSRFFLPGSDPADEEKFQEPNPLPPLLTDDSTTTSSHSHDHGLGLAPAAHASHTGNVTSHSQLSDLTPASSAMGMFPFPSHAHSYAHSSQQQQQQIENSLSSRLSSIAQQAQNQRKDVLALPHHQTHIRPPLSLPHSSHSHSLKYNDNSPGSTASTSSLNLNTATHQKPLYQMPLDSMRACKVEQQHDPLLAFTAHHDRRDSHSL